MREFGIGFIIVKIGLVNKSCDRIATTTAKVVLSPDIFATIKSVLKETVITRSFSHLPAYRLWVVSILVMTIPPLIGIFSFDFSEVGDSTERLVFFFGFFVEMIDRSNFFEKIGSFAGYKFMNAAAITLICGITAMWFMILALPAFNKYSMKKRARLHVIQFIYAAIQAAAGYYYLVKMHGP